MPAPEPAIRISGLAKYFGPKPALRSLDLDVRDGDCLVVTGPNGAGKSTLLRVVAGLTRPSSGSLELLGRPIGRRLPDQLRARIGYLGHQPLLYADLTGWENLLFFGRLYEVPQLGRRIREVAAAVGIQGNLEARVRTYSRGMQQRLAIARAVLNRPRLLLLDEPYTGLDEDGRRELDRLLGALKASSATILMSTHSLEWGADLWDRGLLLVGGRKVHEAGPEGLVQGLRQAWRGAVRPSAERPERPRGAARPGPPALERLP